MSILRRLLGRPGKAADVARPAPVVPSGVPDGAPAHDPADGDPEDPRPWLLLGASLRAQERFAEALAAFERALQLEGAARVDGESFVQVAAELRTAGRAADAIALLEAHLPASPSIAGHGEYAQALLTVGRMEEGWRHYEFRWLSEPLLSRRPVAARPPWAGQDLRGKTVLLHYEQGIGDMIQCFRYVPHLRALGATIVAGSIEGLTPGFRGVDRICDEVPVADYDYHVPLFSLPRLFGADVGTVPADVPYVDVAPALAARWAGRVAADGSLRVGLAWAGNPGHVHDRHRSISLRRLTPLLDVAGVRFHSLQKGPAAGEIAALGLALDDLGAELADFGDTAAVVAQLDLVISVDTAVAHLAGALGKPVWLLLPQPAEWRWLERREDTPWYPTMRLFRQPSRGDWDGVVARLREALEDRVREGPRGCPPLPPSPRIDVPAPRARWPEPAHRPGFSAVAETRFGILQYLPDDRQTGLALGWYGEYLPAQLELVARLLRQGATVIEAGAGVGAHALPLSVAIGPGGRLVLFEADPIRRQILRQNLAANRVGNATPMPRVHGRPPAPGAQEGGAASGEAIDELQLERLDGIKLGAGVDVAAVLAGAASTLWRCRPWWFVAAADAAALAAHARRAQEFGYRCWRHESPWFNPANFNRRDDDRYGGRRALALLALPEELDVDVALDGCVEL